jgi:DNA invertase Pin-like site-specific DNA recombinase
MESDMIIGYARVSTDGQTLDAQQSALSAAGAERVLAEKMSGAVTDRKRLPAQLRLLALATLWSSPSSTALRGPPATSSTTLDAIGSAGATFRSLRDAWADMTMPHGRLMLTVLGGLAEFERHLILARTSEGRTRAKARGVRFGRKLKLTPYQRQEALARRAQGEPLVEIARTFGVSHSTISRLHEANSF